MRKEIKFSLIAIVAMFAIGCTDWVETELIPEVPSLAGGTITEFNAGMGEEESRAGLNASNQSIWHSGDNMTIVKFNPGQTTPQVLHAAALSSTISSDGRTMTFACEMPIHAEGEQYAIFPAQTDQTTENYTSGKIGNRSFKVELPEQELAADGSFRYPFLLGHWKKPVAEGVRGSFQFSNPFTILKITLKKPASEKSDLVLTSIQVKGNNDELMWGSAQASIIDNGNGSFTKGVKMVQGAETFANLDTRIDGVGQTITAEGKDFYVCIPAQNYAKGMTLTFFCEGDSENNIWYMEQPLMSGGVDCSAKANTLVKLPALDLNVEKSSIFTALVRPTATTLAMAWTTKYSNAPYLDQQKPSDKANYSGEYNYSYIIELWTNSACQYNTKTLVQSWIIKDNCFYETQGDSTTKRSLFAKNARPMRFCFTYLKPSTTYYFRVKYSTTANADVNNESQWKVLEHPRKVETLDPFVGASGTILFEDFRDCVLGGDYSTRSAGYSNYDRGDFESVSDAAINIYNTNASESSSNTATRLKLPNLEGLQSGAYGNGTPWYVVEQGIETGLFNTMCNYIASTTGYYTYGKLTSKLKDWAWYSDDNTAGTILMRAGYIKVGAMFKHTGIVTPALSSLDGPSTVTVEFWACPYGASTIDEGEKSIAVRVLDGASVYKDTSTTASERWSIRTQLNRIDVATIDNITSTLVPVQLEGNQYSWKKYSVTVSGVLPTSRIAICSNRSEQNTNNRFLLDDVHIYRSAGKKDGLTVKLVRATDSTISFAWSSNATNIPYMSSILPQISKTSFASEVGDTYAVAIYDKNKTLMCKMSGLYKDGDGNVLFAAENKPPRWTFTGLEPATTYYIKAWNTTKGIESSLLEVTTPASLAEKDDVVPLDQIAVPGHMLLFHNFAGCLYGGCVTSRTAGYKHKSYVAGGNYLVNAGEQTHNTSAYYTMGYGANVGLFSTTKVQVNNTLDLAGWSWVYSDNGTASSSIMIKPGYVQVGTGACNNWLATPALTNMPQGKSTLRVTFRACPYGAASETLSDSEKAERAIALRVLTGGSVGSDYQLTGYKVDKTHNLTLTSNNQSEWKEYTVELYNVPQGARIAFGGGRTDYGENRWLLDDVRVQLINNSELLVGVVRATDTTINLGWTVTAANAGKFLVHRPATTHKNEKNETVVDYKFDFNSVDNTHNYMLYIYTDEACTNLYQSWNCAKDFWHDGATTTDGVTTYGYNYPTRFIISGLTPSTDYYVIVRDSTTGQQSSAVKVSTIAPQYQGKNVVTDPDAVTPGNTILFQNFGKLYYGGDLAGYAMGYTVNSAHIGSLTENYNAQGPTPYGNDTRTDFDRCRCDKEHAIFTTCAGLLDDFGMSDWSYFSDDNSCRVSIHPGYVKLGGGSQKGTLVTPLLTAIPAGKTYSVKVRFKVCPYATIGYNSENDNHVHVSAYEGGSVNNYLFTNGSIVDSKTIDMSSHIGEWKMYEVTLKNITSDCRVGIGGARPTAGDCRFFLDDIEILLVDASEQKYLAGYIKDANGNGVAGVMVSDGYHVVKTNEKGRYQIVYEPNVFKPEFLFYTTPAGYEIGRAGTGLPVTYSKVGSGGNPDPENGDFGKDFTLGAKMTTANHANYNTSTGKQDKWFLFVMADPQTHSATYNSGADKCLQRFIDYVAPDIKARVDGFNSATSGDGTPRAYGVILGDVSWDAEADHHAKMKAALEVSDTGVYWFAAPGNHDYWQYGTETKKSLKAFKEVYGPSRMSFDRGDIHVITINDVYMKSDDSYEAGFTDEEFTWIKNDLSCVDKSKGVVLCAHIPFRGGSSNFTAHYYDAVLTELAKFQHAYIFTGHTHKQETYVHTKYPTAGGDYVTEIVHSAPKGTFWNTSMCTDGTPAGYTIYTFEGSRAKHQRFKAIGNTKDINNFRNNLRMMSAYERISGSNVTSYYYNRGDTGKKGRIIANVYMSHQDGGTPGELSGDWVVQLYDSSLKKWVDMVPVTKTNNTRSVPATFPSVNYDGFIYANEKGTKVLRNDVDWLYWSNVVEANSYITNRNGNNWGGAPDNDGYQASCTHLWMGDLSYQLTDNQIAGTASHTVKVRAIPPCYGTSSTVQKAIADGTDLDGYAMIYICNELTHYGKDDADYYGFDWTSVTGSGTIYKK